MNSPSDSSVDGAMMADATHLEAIWSELDAQITPFIYVLTIPGHLFRSLESAGKNFVAGTFMNYVQESVMFCRDGTGKDLYYLGHPRHFMRNGGVLIHHSTEVPVWFKQNDCDEANSISLAALPVVKPKKIPRPPNAYILYRKDRHELVKKSHPGITNNEISQVLGAAWNSETREIRTQYKKKADDIKTEFFKEHPDYQYKPRRASEKRRRARRVSPATSPASNLPVFSPFTQDSVSPTGLTETLCSQILA